MPYIKREKREELWEVDFNWPDTPGELNYMFSQLARNYCDSKGLSYQTINDIVGALEGAKLEFYRRVAVSYEEEAIKRNGDLYE